MTILKNIFLGGVLFGLMIEPIFSQDVTDMMNRRRCINRNILDRVMNIEYLQPSEFIEDSTGWIGLYISGVPSDFQSREVDLISKDSSFIASFSIFNPVTKEDSVKFYASANFNVVDMEHIRFADFIVKRFYGENADWKNYAHYYSSYYTKIKFNADTVFSVSFPLDNTRTHYQENTFSACTVLFFQKKGRGYVAIFCIYNETKKNKDTYMATIEDAFRYREGDPELKRIEGGDAIVQFKVGSLQREMDYRD